nr:ribonuclease H-like domain, reverse transcriptase, RNA-dependent DNA polymerase [Tanacetum cinerariifolium]
MTLTFAETHNMIAHILKFDASEGFNQIIDFLKGSSIKYALTVNPNIYVSCIKQFWNSVAVKKEIFAELARIGYEKPSTKLTFYKAFFSSQWKFLIHTMLQCMSAKRTSWNEFTSSMASAVICLSTCRKFNFSKYIFNGLKVGEDVDAVHVEAVNAVGVATEEIYKIDLEHANKVLSMQDEEDSEPAKLQEVVDVVTSSNIITKVVTASSDIITAASTTINAADDVPILAATIVVTPKLTAAPSRRRKGVVIRDPQETATTTSTIIHSKAKSKNKGKRILRKQKEDKAVKRYQALKRKPQTEAQARKNMMIYLRNVVVFKMDYFKPKLDEEVEKIKRHLQIVPNDEDDIYTEATPLARKVLVDYEIYNENNKSYFKIKRADGSHQLYISFLSMLRNFDREDSEVLWKLVKERFAITKPENFPDDFLLITLGAMFEKPNIQA